MVKMLKKLVRRYFAHFYYFYTYLRYRIILALLMSMLVGILDGFGLAMFLPLLQIVDSNGATSDYDTEGMGNLSFIVSAMKSVGLPFTLTTILMVMLAFFVAKGFFKFLEGLFRVINQRFFIKKLRFSNIDLLTNYNYKAFVLSDSGRIQNTFSGEVERVVTAYRSYFSSIQYGMLVFVYMVLALLANAQFAALVVIGGGLTNFLYKRIYNITKRLSREVTKENHSFQGLLMQEVSFFKYLKATGYLASYGKRLKLSILQIEKRAKRIGILSSGLQAVREPIVISIVSGVILLQVTAMGQPLGLIILSLLFFYRALSFLMTVQNYWNTFLGVSGSLENMSSFSSELKSSPDIQGDHAFERFDQGISVEKVGFRYGQSRILADVSFQITKNQTLALVGESGSGKTTLMNLLAGLMLPDTGDILIDGISMAKFNRTTLQRRIGYITQDPVVFNDTIYNNVTLWAPRTQENVHRFREVLKKAAILDFVEGLPERENAQLGNNGILISGGQKQRLSIARELYREVEFLFFDEATSALDSETERAIQRNIEALKGQYTIIIIAHRLSTVRHADKIVVMSKGRVDTTGSYEHLTTHSATFRRMVALQEV